MALSRGAGELTNMSGGMLEVTAALLGSAGAHWCACLYTPQEVLRQKDHALYSPTVSSVPCKPQNPVALFLHMSPPVKGSAQRVCLVNHIILVSMRAEGLPGVQKNGFCTKLGHAVLSVLPFSPSLL